MEHILSYIIFTPLLFALILLVVPKNATKVLVGLSFFASLVTLALALKLYVDYEPSAGFAFVESIRWIRAWNVDYKVGIDGVSLLLVLLTAFTLPLVILFSAGSIQKQHKEYYFCLLLLQTAMLGTFCALDLFVFYVFWETMLIPMYLLIGIWGGERRIYAALKLFLYTLLGSVLMLAAIIYLYLQAGQSFDYSLWLEKIHLAPQIQIWVFAAFALAFAIKVPMFPLHTWLPDAHVEAPTAGSVILAGILLKMGTYGFYRFAMPLFPQALHQAQPLLITLSVIGIVYGALVSMVQPDIKKLIAYSSVSHLGFVMLGLLSLTTQGVQGAVYQMLNHGISTGALFLLVGMIYDRRHTRLVSEYGGIAKVMPLYSIFFLIVTFSSIGLPGTNGFVGEFLILLGSFQTQPWAATIAASGVILAAVYMLWMVQRVFFGPLKNPKNEGLKDLGLRETAILLPLIVLIFWMGVYPKPIFQKMEVSVNQFLSQVKR
ncbi:MAG: NADH-quinone oxidoreductase subunit M [Deltaproteobacteria bacterium]|nr:NADH-quinone oxidoreductase subunit M [Deltaproteobacteria bacterium]